MIEYDSKIIGELFDILQESIAIGLGRAASVIGQLADSHVKLSTTKVYMAENVMELPMFSDRIVVMEVKGDVLQGETVFSMNDEQLIKFIRHLEGLDEIDSRDEDIFDVIEDTYKELGNIILGNIISSIVDFFDVRVNINVPYTIGKAELEELSKNKLLVVDVQFGIDKLNADGKLYLINNYDSYIALAKHIHDSEKQ